MSEQPPRVPEDQLLFLCDFCVFFGVKPAECAGEQRKKHLDLALHVPFLRKKT